MTKSLTARRQALWNDEAEAIFALHAALSAASSKAGVLEADAKIATFTLARRLSLHGGPQEADAMRRHLIWLYDDYDRRAADLPPRPFSTDSTGWPA